MSGLAGFGFSVSGERAQDTVERRAQHRGVLSGAAAHPKSDHHGQECLAHRRYVDGVADLARCLSAVKCRLDHLRQDSPGGARPRGGRRVIGPEFRCGIDDQAPGGADDP